MNGYMGDKVERGVLGVFVGWAVYLEHCLLARAHVYVNVNVNDMICL